MKKLLGIGILAMLILALMVVPAFAGNGCGDNEGRKGKGLDIVDKNYDDVLVEDIKLFEMKFHPELEIEDEAFQNIKGLFALNFAAGVGNVQASDVDLLMMDKADYYELSARDIEVKDIKLFKMSYCGDLEIEDNAFRYLEGAAALNFAVGVGNVQSAEINIAVDPCTPCTNYND